MQTSNHICSLFLCKAEPVLASSQSVDDIFTEPWQALVRDLGEDAHRLLAKFSIASTLLTVSWTFVFVKLCIENCFLMLSEICSDSLQSFNCLEKKRKIPNSKMICPRLARDSCPRGRRVWCLGWSSLWRVTAQTPASHSGIDQVTCCLVGKYWYLQCG